MNTIAEYDCKIPVYALSYLVNGDDLVDNDQQATDKWYSFYTKKARQKNGYVLLSAVNDNSEPYFSSSPAFGLPCYVEDYKILICK